MAIIITKPVKTKRRMHPNSLANLVPHQYKPGENGHGRVYPLKERLYHALDKPLIEPKPDACAGERVVYSTLKGAIELVPVAFRETWDRAEGKLADVAPPSYQDNRQINLIIDGRVIESTEAKALMGNIARRLLPKVEEGKEG